MIARTTISLLRLNSNYVQYGFCMGKALLNPYKHTTMSHSPHNMFVDLYDFGQYPQIIIQSSIAAKTYQPIVVSTLINVLNQQYGLTLTNQDILNNLQKTWQRFLIKNLNSNDSFQQAISPVLNKLAVNIFVRQSRWTWIKEQRQRLNGSSIYFSQNKPQTLGDFITSYNSLIQELVLASTFGLSPHIPQAPTPLQKHYVQQMHYSQHLGVYQLNQIEGEKDNFINKAMAFIHRI